jgi:predicted Zn-dependent protease
MPVLTTPDMIAVVMSHEMGHAIARHGNERMTQQTLSNILGAVAGEIIEQKTSENGRAIFETAYAIGSQYGYLLPYSRKHELEADEIGLYIMAIAGYDINQAPLLWEKMAQASTTYVPEVLSTHPSDSKRMKNLEKLLEKARKYSTKAK